MSSNGMASAISSNHSAVQGFCRRMEQCSLVAAFVVIIGLAIFLNYTRTVPLFFISIRWYKNYRLHIFKTYLNVDVLLMKNDISVLQQFNLL